MSQTTQIKLFEVHDHCLPESSQDCPEPAPHHDNPEYQDWALL